ncbi:MAG TPA: hypothetical protein VNG33_14375 [Polyangiaceae bacterium]|nr:hypothetical protein [Polyangiaceae bacterium]
MKRGLSGRGKWGLGWTLLFGLLGACASSKETDGTTFKQPPAPACVAGKICGCESGSGTTFCDASGNEECKCRPCPTLDVVQPPSVSCGGDAAGLWLLTDEQLAPNALSITLDIQVVGNCPTVFKSPTVQHLLMALHENGSAEYLAEAGTLSESWLESCVTRNAPQLACGAAAWHGVENCKLVCDVCACDVRFTTNDATPQRGEKWSQNAGAISLAPWGMKADFNYCVSDDKLELSSKDGYFAFKRKYARVTPGMSCGLSDYGKVAGCELVDQRPACEGTPAAACEPLDAQACSGTLGCTLSTPGACTGGQLDCAKCSVCDPKALCTFTGNACVGTPSCKDFKTHEDCYSIANIDFPNNPCTWSDTATSCGGTPTSCAELSMETCETSAGCQLVFP